MDGLVQERSNSIADALELCMSCSKRSMRYKITAKTNHVHDSFKDVRYCSEWLEYFPVKKWPHFKLAHYHTNCFLEFQTKLPSPVARIFSSVDNLTIISDTLSLMKFSYFVVFLRIFLFYKNVIEMFLLRLPVSVF